MQPFLHNGEIVFKQIQQSCLDTVADAEPGEDKPGDFDALAITTRAADDDGDVKH